MPTRREFLIVGTTCLSACTTSPTVRNTPNPIVETTSGRVRGVSQDGVVAFKGIPYGASTAATGRFMPPQAPAAWAGVRDCVAWGPNAPQPGSAAGGSNPQMRALFGANPDVPTTQSEDCLVLNVFTPALRDGRKRPVMFWIHGGGFAIGQGSGARTNGTNLAKRQDVVTVSVNHRLGVMGYCDLSSFSPQFERSATVGQLDLVLALQWVRDNIEAFGGDPDRVMIHGDSGGGFKVSTLLAMPPAAGLFSRAVCQSGVAMVLPNRQGGRDTATALLRELQIDASDVRRLQDVPMERLIAAASVAGAGASPTSGRGFAPAVGGPDLPVTPFEASGGGISTRHPAHCRLHAT